MRYESVDKCAKTIGVHRSSLYSALKKGHAAHGFHYYYAEKPRPSKEFFDHSGRKQPVKVRCIETGEVFESIRQLNRARERNKPLLDFLVENPRVYTRYDLADRFGIDAKKCYEIVRGAGMTALIKPVREKIDIENLITDYENGMTLNELASKYDSSYAYIRRLTSSCRGNPKPKLLSDDEKREIIRLHGDGMTVTAIARSIGRSSTAVAKVLRQNGLETDLRVPKQTIAQAETLIREGNKSYREIATLLGMSPSNVSRVARTISAVPNYKHNAKKVLCVESGEVFSSASEAQRCLSTPNSGGVSAACRSGKKYKGCHWKYVDDEDDR